MRDPVWPSSLYRDPAQFWPLIILSTAVCSIVPIGTSGRELNLSMFEEGEIVCRAGAVTDTAFGV